MNDIMLIAIPLWIIAMCATKEKVIRHFNAGKGPRGYYWEWNDLFDHKRWMRAEYNNVKFVCDMNGVDVVVIEPQS